ncbi:AMP-dependent synthetase and ligase [Dethiobacter alkaliphilus AHT 1]|uniref:AMP-dependent synthetase and ligase n=2 Tax=Dethiobacter TaxID=427925 RepID=C0GDC2_DETAL|nr:AMP-dependent synthetase and ligase [Dethiobacter alkaliphilus AHT 1]
MKKPWLEYYTEGMKPSVEVPELSVPAVFLEMCAKYGKKTAIIFYGKQLTYNELKKQVESLAAALAELGVGKGDVVALYVLNSPQYIISYMAVLMTGAAVTPVSPVFTSHELKYQLQDSGSKTIICQDILYENLFNTGLDMERVIITGIDEYLPPLKKLLGKTLLKNFSQEMNLSRTDIPSQEGFYQFKELLRSSAPPVNAEIDPHSDIASITYSGGTTGPPKGVMLNHHQIIACGMMMKGFFPFLEEGKEVYPAFLPLYHIYGQLVIMVMGLTQGATLVIFTTPDIDEVLAAVERYQCTGFFGVPTMYEYLKEYDKTGRVDWKRLKLLICGADTLHERTVQDWEKRTGTQIIEGYGQTESGGVSIVNPRNRPKTGTMGIPVSNVKAAVIAIDSTEFVPPGEVGEIVLQGPNVMMGYWNKPEATAETLVQINGEQWLRTGDLGYMDEEGYFHFVDRTRDLIKFKGYSIFARDVEEVLYTHPHVKAAGVIGVSNPKVGQMVKANVVLQPEARGKVTEEEIIKFCEESLAHYKVPKIVEFRGELPKTDVGKVSRRELREEEEEAI